jgi:Polysulphide reductase, NrfD
MPIENRRATEDRLESLRAEANRTGRVAGAGLPIGGGPMPSAVVPSSGYYGQPIVKAPVWTWQIGLYLFVGGTAGMSGVIAFASLATGHSFELVRAALGVAFAGALISPVLLIWDLGRPARFLNMLRVFKWRSAMSVGVWTLVAFSGCVGSALVAVGLMPPPGTSLSAEVRVIAVVLVAGTAVTGVVLATYTGVLLGATTVPVWSAHHRLLPFHFGVVGLGSAAAVLELLGFRLAALNAIACAAAIVETAAGGWLEASRRRGKSRAIHHGMPGLLLGAAAILTGPASLVLRIFALIPAAGTCFLIGAVLSRYGWLSAGRASARDPVESLQN